MLDFTRPHEQPEKSKTLFITGIETGCMSGHQQTATSAEVRVENIGGIDETTVTLRPGVTVLSGENATNRTSFLQAIMAAMGSNQATLKGDAEEAFVQLSLGDGVYKRSLRRKGESVQFDGEGYLDDSTVADLFAFLHENNEARRSVAWNEDLRELIMRPIDIDAIQSEIERLEERKAEINDELATIDSRKQELPDLEQQRRDLRERIDEKRTELAAIEDQIDESSRDVEESKRVKEESEELLTELRSVRSNLESVRRDIESQQESITSLTSERSDLRTELQDLPEDPAENDTLDTRVDRLRDRRQELNDEISDLQSLIQYNEQRLDDDDFEVPAEIESDHDDDGAVTDQLLSSEQSIVCWTCGSTVDRDQIEETVDRLREVRTRKVADLEDVKDDLEAVKSERRTARKRQQRREEIERELAGIEDEIERRQERIETLKERRETLTAEVQRLEREVETLESADFEDVLDLHKEANELEFEIESLESEREEVSDTIEEIEELLARAEDLREEREGLVEQLTEERTKIDRIEEDAVEAFNDHMDTVLETLAYENLERIWIERTERTVQDGRKTVQQSVFDLHVVRTTESGTAYEDSITHLSESEREVTGLVFALAGYLVHDLHETVPFMLLDSLEAIDSERIAKLVDYFAEYTEYLVVALLPEDAQALDDEYTRVRSI